MWPEFQPADLEKFDRLEPRLLNQQRITEDT
jgi:hypothetical protein